MWDQRLVRLALLQHLRAAYGIKVKGGRGQCDRRKREPTATETGGKIFGVPFNALPNSVVPEYGHIPSFLVDACTSLEEHLHTEGLFRKSGSVIRLKALKNKLDNGEGGLSSALPCDIAGLLKQFFRELPEPVLPADLHEALFKAQQLGPEEKNTATLLLSCLMADHTVDILRYFFNFLRNVSLRSSKNKMDSSNLAVIFAPNLLQTSEGHEKMSANTEKKLRLQAAVVQTFIDYASDIGRVPDFILEKIPAMLGIDGLCATPSLEGFEEGEHETPSECKRKRRQSVGDFVNGALNKLKSNRTPAVTPQQDGTAQLSVSPMILTPNAKRKLPVDSSHGLSSKKRKSIKHNFNFELLPSNLFSSSSTPLSVHCDTSPEGSSQSSLSPVAISGNHLISAGVLRRSKRIAGKKVCRVESGKAGCFSPKISRKEKVRRSLRLKFSLGKNRDPNGCSGVNRYENVGRRLANQESLKNRIESVKTGLLFSPDIDEQLPKKGSVKISKSEENLVTPERLDGRSYRMSWTGLSSSSFQEMDANEASPRMGNLEVQNFSLEPEITVEKSPGICCEHAPSTSLSKTNSSVAESSLSGDENNLTSETLVKIQKAFSESGNNLHALISHRQSSITNVGKEKINEASYGECKSEGNLLETNDLTVRESEESYENYAVKDESCFSERHFSPHPTQKFGGETTIKCYSTQMKVEHHRHIRSDIQKDNLVQQELPVAVQVKDEQSPKDKLSTWSKENENRFEENLVKCAAPREDEAKSSSSLQSTRNVTNLSKPRPVRIAKQQSLVGTCNKTVSESVHVTEHGKVSDHIQWFNQLSLNESNRTKAKSPLKFHRTPVRQSVRRINSLLEYSRQPVRQKLTYLGDAASPLVKSMSCDSALPSCTENTSKESSISCTRLGPREQKSIKMKRHPDSGNASLGSTKVCKPEVIPDGQVKVPLEDLTNHDILTSVVKNDMGFSPGMKNRVLRKPSERERAWYKGSPKCPIAKAQLLPTSKPIDL
ncbi:PREDICTED: rho GTPase-activating protein 11A [Chinchilla lanigera]|uniref:Rho GTPase-activating protein 11A n=1 Tax=Chinchilla lanigera TaxID=34839 RepID=A0A8C2VIQ3_CHILA|nr:PREDICTED: rho GTPase-activating protein 11A [Chinchilla lanigera]XP_013368119.1 PREDICTED: rho GTPase-activating protein 11A [Chinchilla lanigera]